MNEDFERTSYLQNGMFYTAQYTPRTTVPGYDVNPLLLILGPAKHNINCVVALNFHHIGNIDDRCKILSVISNLADISKFDIDAPMITEDACRRLFPFAKDAIRVYNRKSFREVYRVKSNCVGKYIEYNGDIMMKSPSFIMNKYWLNYGANTTPEAAKPQANEDK